MEGSRPVRIPREARREVVGGRNVADPAVRRGRSDGFVPNTAARTRALRLLSVYLVALVVIYTVFAGLTVTAPDPGTRSNVGILVGLAAIALVLSVLGWALTFGRTPSALKLGEEELCVRERGGRVRRFAAPPVSRLRVAERYPASLLSPGQTALVEIAPPEGRRRSYVLDAGLLTNYAAMGDA